MSSLKLNIAQPCSLVLSTVKMVCSSAGFCGFGWYQLHLVNSWVQFRSKYKPDKISSRLFEYPVFQSERVQLYEWKPSLVNRSWCLLLLSSHNEVQIRKFWGTGTSYILTASHCIDFPTYSCVLIVTFRNFLRISCFGQKNKILHGNVFASAKNSQLQNKEFQASKICRARKCVCSGKEECILSCL